jgi:hypothetical protein
MGCFISLFRADQASKAYKIKLLKSISRRLGRLERARKGFREVKCERSVLEMI